MRPQPFAFIVLATVACIPAIARGQALERPQRAYRGIFGGGPQSTDPNRSRTEVTLSVNALGGYDDNAAIGEGGGGAPLTTPAVGGYTGTYDGRLRFFSGRPTRNFTFAVAGSGNVYAEEIPLSPNRTVTGTAGFISDLGRRTSVLGGGSAGYTRNFAISGPLTANADPEILPTSPNVFGIGNRPSNAFSGFGTLNHQWSRLNRTIVNYNHLRTRFTDDDGGDSRTHNVTATFARQVTRSTAITAGYGYVDTLFAFGAPGDDGRPSIEHRISGGFSTLRRLSPRRTTSFSLSAGAVRIESETGLVDPVPYQTWAPFVSAASQLDLGRDWNLSGSYNRSAQVLEGLSTDAFFTDAVSLGVSGLASRRVDLAFLTSFAAGSVAVDTSASSYTTMVGSVQTRIALTRMLAVTANYFYYRYNFDNTVLPEGVAPEFGRHAFRVGLSISLPLYGSGG